MDRYHSFDELAANHEHGVDYRITVIRQPASPVAIIAPHAGHIERGTSAIARALAGDDFNLYLFEGLRASHNYESLHITSHRFDEPRCLSLISDSAAVVSIHGCRGEDEKIYLGGRHRPLIDHFAMHLLAADLDVETENHAWPGKHPENICNRGLTAAGVQIELSSSLREGPSEPRVISSLRQALFEYVQSLD